MSGMLTSLGQWMTRVQVWVLTWIATHIVETRPFVYQRPGEPALWRASWWRDNGKYTVQFYRNGQHFGTGSDLTPYRAYQTARRNTRQVMHERGIRRRRT
jgi:hypothetical protein